MISYAQNSEDVLLSRALSDIQEGFYIDVGANSPVVDSVTCHFYENGWRGINLEPGDLYEKLAQQRPRDINIKKAVSCQSGQAVLYVFPGLGITTLAKEEAEAHRQNRNLMYEITQVELISLAEVCSLYVRGEIDFLSVDVEGSERSVLESNDWSMYRPRIVLVEATRPMTAMPTHHLWEDVLLKSGYRFAVFDGLNRFYVREEDSHRIESLQVHPNLFDGYVSHREKLLLERLQYAEAELAWHNVSLPRAALRRTLRRFPRFTSGLKRLIGRKAG